MYKLEMKPPAFATLRLLMNKLEFNDDALTDWLRRGRRPYEEIFEAKGSEYFADEEVREAFFAAEDRMPQDLREAAYRVEARRSLLYQAEETVVLSLMVLIIAAFFAGLVIGVVPGVTIAVGGLALGTWTRRLCERKARDLIEWRQGLEPALWALYYPLQLASEVEKGAQRLRDAGETTISAQWEALESEVARDPDGKMLPGQEDRLRAFSRYLNVELPAYLTMDSGRLIGGLILNRAPVAAALVRTELMNQTRSGSGTGGETVADRTAQEVYGYLMRCGERFVRLPRPPKRLPEPDTPLASVLSEKYFSALLTEVEALRSAAHDLARGEMPAGDSVREELPSRKGVAGQLLGAGMIALGVIVNSLYPDYASWGQAFIAGGAGLLPGVLGKIIEKAATVKSPAPVT